MIADRLKELDWSKRRFARELHAVRPLEGGWENWYRQVKKWTREDNPTVPRGSNARLLAQVLGLPADSLVRKQASYVARLKEAFRQKGGDPESLEP